MLKAPDPEWDDFYAIFKVKLDDGTTTVGPVKRRKVHGVWKYRAMDEDEAFQFLQRDAW